MEHPELTPTEHVETLISLARHYEKAVEHFTRAGESPAGKISTLYAKRAAAIRWILAETAHGVDVKELAV
ncbi:MAG TPA: hypothetical protein VN903_14350 [Polyangia bacterium]|nr:hypothetical protein [Polyangia bacterium]